MVCDCLLDDSPQTDHMTAEDASRYKKTRTKKNTPALAPVAASEDTMSITGRGIH